MRTLLLLIFWASTAIAANDIASNPYIIDTASSTMVVTTRTWVTGIRWVGATTAGHQAIVQDTNGRELWSAVATAANYSEEGIIPLLWRGGFKVPTLGSGKLYIYLREGSGNP